MSTYTSPLANRYASPEMAHLFSHEKRGHLFRKLWSALAKEEAKLGLLISKEQLEELEAHVDTIDFAAVAKHEEAVGHDVMAHILAYGDQCPKAKGIIHLGATSAFVTDNSDLLQMKEALAMVSTKLDKVIGQLANLAKEHRTLPCLSWTHFQPAQPTTVGRRLCLYIQDLLIDAKPPTLKFRGVKGATGTQSSFLTLFDGDEDKVVALDKQVAEAMGFTDLFPLSSQTYTRRQDVQVLDHLCGIAISCAKFATDMRLLSHLGEVEEPRLKDQVGSSTMPHKRNPMLCERIGGLSRFLLSLGESMRQTAANQWLERSLDDSSNRRLVIPEAFLTIDAILELMIRVTGGLKIFPKIIQSNLESKLPLVSTEHRLMEGVKQGADRQELHAQLRRSVDAGDLPAEDPQALIGRSISQVDEFLSRLK